jgi:hypothetical protein
MYEKIHKVNIEGKELGHKIKMIKDNIIKSLQLNWEDFLDTYSRNDVLSFTEKIISNDNIETTN